jgi:putative ABC transport system ATP-binding protein
VLLPSRLGGPQPRDVEAVLTSVGLGGLGPRAVGELSGGQRQRVAVARALITRPAVIFADEPTGALDPTTGAMILDLLRAAVDRDGVTVVMVTHDPAAAAFSDRLVLLRAGREVADDRTPDTETIAVRLRAVSGAVLAGARSARAGSGAAEAPSSLVASLLSPDDAGPGAGPAGAGWPV